jgi:hypothetical protein
MRLIVPAALCLLVLAACGDPPEGKVRYFGKTPDTNAYEMDEEGNWVDNRYVKTYCPWCEQRIEPGTLNCPDEEQCGCEEIVWPDDYNCWWCGGTGDCKACIHMEQIDLKGKCYNCKGEGVIAFEGKARPCPNCKDTGVCPICKGTMKCDICKGEKTVGNDVISKRHVEITEEEQFIPPIED